MENFSISVAVVTANENEAYFFLKKKVNPHQHTSHTRIHMVHKRLLLDFVVTVNFVA